MSNFFATKSNAAVVLYKLLQSFPVDRSLHSVALELFKHPEYPSMFSIREVLTKMGVNNDAYRADLDKLSGLKCPFIAYTKMKGEEFVLVEKVTSKYFVLSTQRQSNRRILTDKFRDVYENIILLAESPAKKPVWFPLQRAFLASRGRLITSTFFVALILILYNNSEHFKKLDLGICVLTVVKLLGLLTSVLLLRKAIDSEDLLVQRICNKGESVDCDAILNSDAAKVFEGLTWSEVGFYYFTSTILLLFFGTLSSNLVWLSLFNLLALPYTFYSLYYQLNIAKKWCKLCCIAQATLWAEFIVMTTMTKHVLYREPLIMDGKNIAMIGACVAIPVLFWSIAKPVIKQAKLYWPLKEQADQFKYDLTLFNSLLKGQPRFSSPDPAWSITLGAAIPKYILTVVSSPFCKPCFETHQEIEELLAGNLLQVRIIFKGAGKYDFIGKLQGHLMAIGMAGNDQRSAEALHSCYSQQGRNYETWALEYPVNADPELVAKALYLQDEWCVKAGVIGTPTVFLNGYQLPASYRPSDLKYMLD